MADRAKSPTRTVAPPTPTEIQAVRTFALAHPAVGYKRLTWWMVDADVAYLKEHQVLHALRDGDLLRRRGLQSDESLRRPPPASRPDEQWHIDIMYVWVRPTWYYLVDIIDAFSRFIVHWTLNPTMTSDTVLLTVQEAVDRLETRQPGEPKVVHDSGSQFISRDWHSFVGALGLTDIRTRVAHPQSNGCVERLHRTHRQEALAGQEPENYYAACDLFARHVCFYNHSRPHTAINCMPPVVFYRGDPAAHAQLRQHKLQAALAQRQAFWQQSTNRRETSDLSSK